MINFKKQNMKKILISLLLIFWIFSQNSQIFAYEQAISPEDFSKFLEWISENWKDLNEFIPKKELWKVSLEMAWFDRKDDQKFFITPIKWILAWEEYSEYAQNAYKFWLLEDYRWKEIDPNSYARKYETIKFLLWLFGVNTPFLNDQIMDFRDVKNDDPIVSKCLELAICKWNTNKIFWKNSPVTRAEFYQYLIKTYSYVYDRENFYHQQEISSFENRKFLILENIFETIKTEFYKRDALEQDNLIYWAAEWMANAVWDKYTKFFKPAKSKNFNESLDWSFEWIWAYIEHDDEWIKIVTPMNWSPAKNAWLKANDVVLEADWKILKNYTLEEWVSFIKWKAWTVVKLKIKRWNDILYFDVKRWKVFVPSVESEILDEKILYIKINQFWANTDKELFQILFENIENEKIIFDLRDNPWGYLDVAKNILSMFVKSWNPIVKIKYPDFEVVNYSSEKIDKFPVFDWVSGKKIAILTNWWSASASEIFAWTMQDYWLAKVFWDTTYWKWTVQNLVDFYDWSQFKITIANWKTWKWREIEWKWVKPDEKIFQDEWKFWDEVLKAAKNFLR